MNCVSVYDNIYKQELISDNHQLKEFVYEKK